MEWEICSSAIEAVGKLHKEGYEVYALEQVENSIKLQNFKTQKGKKYAIILGNEVKGVSQDAVNACDGAIEIPQFGTKHSMNVSVSGGIAIWHIASQLLALQ